MKRQNSSRLTYVALAPRLAARALVRAYQLSFAAFASFNCRHLPTCSQYADEAIGRFGLWGGGWMTMARLCRCHPFGTSGLDPVPTILPDRASWYLPWRYGRWCSVHPIASTPSMEQTGANGRDKPGHDDENDMI